jgi:hypothetical protein
MTRDRCLIAAAIASLAYTLWAGWGPSRCPACRARRTVGDRMRGYHACDWS